MSKAPKKNVTINRIEELRLLTAGLLWRRRLNRVAEYDVVLTTQVVADLPTQRNVSFVIVQVHPHGSAATLGLRTSLPLDMFLERYELSKDGESVLSRFLAHESVSDERKAPVRRFCKEQKQPEHLSALERLRKEAEEEGLDLSSLTDTLSMRRRLGRHYYNKFKLSERHKDSIKFPLNASYKGERVILKDGDFKNGKWWFSVVKESDGDDAVPFTVTGNDKDLCSFSGLSSEKFYEAYHEFDIDFSRVFRLRNACKRSAPVEGDDAAPSKKKARADEELAAKVDAKKASLPYPQTDDVLIEWSAEADVIPKYDEEGKQLGFYSLDECAALCRAVQAGREETWHALPVSTQLALYNNVFNVFVLPWKDISFRLTVDVDDSDEVEEGERGIEIKPETVHGFDSGEKVFNHLNSDHMDWFVDDNKVRFLNVSVRANDGKSVFELQKTLFVTGSFDNEWVELSVSPKLSYPDSDDDE